MGFIEDVEKAVSKRELINVHYKGGNVRTGTFLGFVNGMLSVKFTQQGNPKDIGWTKSFRNRIMGGVQELIPINGVARIELATGKSIINKGK